MTVHEFTAECAQRRIDYDRIFGHRKTPEWLKKLEQQVMDECRANPSYFDDPIWRRVFEMRAAEHEAANRRTDNDQL